MLDAVNGPSFHGGSLIIKDKKGKDVGMISADNVDAITPGSLLGGENYTTIRAGVAGSVSVKIPYQTVVTAYEKAKYENVSVELNEADYQ